MCLHEIKPRNGFTLLTSVVMLSLLLLLAVILAKIVYNSYAIEIGFIRREKAFWAAEAGLEKGKAEVSRCPGWYTDLPHVPADDKDWLRDGAVGQDEGWFKLVREQGKNVLYSVGGSGEARVFLKISYSFPPLRQASWEEL